MNETIENILNRRSVRSYLDRPIADELLDRILTCGIYAPSGRNQQEIKLTAIANPTIIEEICALARKEFAQMEEQEGQYTNIAIRNAKTKPDYNFAFHAPVLVIATGPAAWPNGMADAALALGNVMLAATSLGIASCYVNQLHWLDQNAPMREYLEQVHIDRAEEVYGSVVLGYTEAAKRAPSARKEGRIQIIR